MASDAHSSSHFSQPCGPLPGDPVIPLPPPSTRSVARSLTFVSDGRRRRVDLRAPRPLRRDGQWMVRLMDLWVASGLPGDFLDLTFEIVTARSARAAVLEPEVFARAYVLLATRELWRDDAQQQGPTGLRVRSIVVRAGAPAPAAAPPPLREENVRPVLLVAPYAVGLGACRAALR